MTSALSKVELISGYPDELPPRYHPLIRMYLEVEVGVFEPNVQPLALLPQQEEGIGVVAKSFRALGDPTRLRLLDFLLQGERTVGECVEHVGLAQSRVSSHLACLADCGYISARREGRRNFYQVTDPRLAQLVTLARSLAADNAYALADCVRIDRPSAT